MRRKGKLLAEVQRIISEARKEGETLREQAPSRSTGQRREYQRSHEALNQIERLVRPAEEE